MAGAGWFAYRSLTEVGDLAGRTEPAALYDDPTLLFEDPGILGSAIEALHQAQTGCKRKEESSQLRRRIEEAEGIIKKAKRELRLA